MISESTAFEINWDSICSNIEQDGYSSVPAFLSDKTCDDIQNFYSGKKSTFRSTISMERYNFGIGEYKYFSYPLPKDIQLLREYFYSKLAPIANEWNRRLNINTLWPDNLTDLIKLCNDEGQCRPTPLLLRYEQGGYNCLHQDIYGSIHFPFQVIAMLSKPQVDFEGGELILVEQRPRMQSRAIIPRLEKGGAVIIPVQHRPRKSVRGYHRANMRHGVSEITSGLRHTLGIIFHDAT